MESLESWWPLFSTIFNVVLLCWGIYQLVKAKEEIEKKKSQVKIWHVISNGISQSLYRVCLDIDLGLYSSVKDVKNAVWTIHSNANSLFQSLYEERVVDEKEYKEEQKEIREKIRKQADQSFIHSSGKLNESQ